MESALVVERVAEHVRTANVARAQFLSLAFAATWFVAGLVDAWGMGTLRNHGFMAGQLIGSLTTAAIVRWTLFGQRHAGGVFTLGTCFVSASGAAHLSQFGGLDGPWFYGSYTAPPILIAMLLPLPLRIIGSFGCVGLFTFVYQACRPDLFSHPMAHVPIVYLVMVSVISIALGRYVHGLEVESFSDMVRLDATATLLESRLRTGAVAPTQVRREIARQLHDDVAQLITGARLHLDGWSQRREKDHAVTRLGEVLDELSRRAHRMIDELRTPPARGPLIDELERLRAEYAGLGLEVDVLVDDGARDLPPGGPQLDVLVSSAREALTNAIRHGGANEATLSVNTDARSIALLVLDNGGGHLDDVREGYGLLGIRERVQGVGGTAELSEYEAGLRLAITLPRAEAT